MKYKISNVLITLILLSTPYLVSLAILFQKNWTSFISQPLQQTIITNNSQGLLNSGIRVSYQATKLREIFSVKDFGAVGNGEADDTKAIQAAIDAAFQAWGGIVFFPSGTYKVSINPSTLNAVKIRANVRIQGAGNKKTIIKLANNQGNYNALLGSEGPSSDLSNFAMYDIAIDGNSSNNPVRKESDFKHGGRFAIEIFAGSKIKIERCRFTNQNNTQTILVAVIESIENYDENLIKNILIKDNIFEFIGGDSIDYDHSTIFARGKNMQILNNHFSTKYGAGTNGARAAIEIHGDEYTVKGNEIVGFTNGIHVTGVAKSSMNQLISDNVIKNAHTGIMIWSYFANGNTTNPALINCTITNNKITLNINSWRKLWGHLPSQGILLHSASNAPIKGLKIANNKIFFTNFSGTGGDADKFASGIYLGRDVTHHVLSEDISISGNTIQNPLAAGIYISMPIKGVEMLQNHILNPGKSHVNFDDAQRAGILVDGNVTNVKINNNYFVDNQTVSTLKGGILWRGNCIATCEAKENYLHVSSGKKIKSFRSLSNSGNTVKVSP